MRLPTQNSSSPLMLRLVMARWYIILSKGARSRIIFMENKVIAQGNIKNKYEPISVPYMVKLDKQFRYSSQRKGQDSETWITELEDFCVRLDDLGSSISENQFMIHAMNNFLQTTTFNLLYWRNELEIKISH
jgi:hypothetical protein